MCVALLPQDGWRTLDCVCTASVSGIDRNGIDASWGVSRRENVLGACSTPAAFLKSVSCAVRGDAALGRGASIASSRLSVRAASYT